MRLSLLKIQLRIPALILAGALILGIGLLAWGLAIHAASDANLLTETAQESNAARSAREAPGKVQASKEETGIYQQIKRSGFLGPEQRTGWITALGQAQTSLKLDSLSWRLAPRIASSLAPGLWSTAMDISVSRVDTAGLESLLDHLRANSPGRFTLERCSLMLNPDGHAGQAECRLNWWTWEDASPRR